MASSFTRQDRNYRCFLVKLTVEAAEGLEDMQYYRQRRERRRVTKRELVEEAVRKLLADGVGRTP
jgi:hypothetical protein